MFLPATRAPALTRSTSLGIAAAAIMLVGASVGSLAQTAELTGTAYNMRTVADIAGTIARWPRGLRSAAAHR
jgi:hypothetical protein